MHLVEILEGKTRLLVPDLRFYKRKEDAPVFYNPVFTDDRDLSVQIFKKFFKKKVKAADILCGLGSRGIRYAKELGFDVSLNDANPLAVELVEKNAKLNKISVNMMCGDANDFLEKSEKFDLIDIDPFGSPVYFLDNAFKKIKVGGIIAISATDLGALSGRFPKRCLKRYKINAVETKFEHELGLRNLIAAAELSAEKSGKSIVPVFAYHFQHYYRVYLKVAKKKKSLGYYLYCKKCGNRLILKNKAVRKCCAGKMIALGPTWIQALGDQKFMKNLSSKFVNLDELEYSLPYVDLHWISKYVKIQSLGTQATIDKLKKKGYMAAKTLLCGHAVKTNAPFKLFLRKNF